jgi:glycerol-3-phosphate dehydrogenase
MLQHYSHVRLEAKRTALDALARRTEKGVVLQEQEDSYVTKTVTNDGSECGGEPQVV